MQLIIPMEVAVHIIRHTSRENNRVSHTATLTIGTSYLALEAGSEEVFWCSASGKSFFACVAALKERVLAWAESYGVQEIAGIADNEPCPLVLNVTKGTTKEEICIVPVTYNDVASDYGIGEPEI